MSLAKDAGSTPVPLISNVKWEPFGLVSGWDWHMASSLVNHTRQFDLSGRIVRYPLGNVLRDVSYDAADRITGFTHLLASDGTPQPALNQGFAHDENSRMTNITTNAANWSIAYDPNGNRTSVSLSGSPSDYTTETTSNRLRTERSAGAGWPSRSGRRHRKPIPMASGSSRRTCAFRGSTRMRRAGFGTTASATTPRRVAPIDKVIRSALRVEVGRHTRTLVAIPCFSLIPLDIFWCAENSPETFDSVMEKVCKNNNCPADSK